MKHIFNRRNNAHVSYSDVESLYMLHLNLPLVIRDNSIDCFGFEVLSAVAIKSSALMRYNSV
jgi:hypothetical protein